MARGTLAVLLAGLCLLAPAVSGAANVFDTINSTASLSLLSNALNLAGLRPTFSNSTLNITYFAPSDTAFYNALALMNLTVNQLVANAPKMAPILLYHAVQPSFLVESFATIGVKPWAGAFAPSVITTEYFGADFFVNVRSVGADANITTEDVSAGTSTVQIIDQVLLPFYPTIASAILRYPGLSTLSALATTYAPSMMTRLGNVLAEYTFFAPTNAAFTASNGMAGSSLSTLLTSSSGVESLLDYHILPSAVIRSANITTTPMVVTTLGGLKLRLIRTGNTTITVIFPTGNATITASYDVGFTVQGSFRAVVHLIDHVLVPGLLATTAQALALRADTITTAATLASDSTYSSMLTSNTFQGTVLSPTDAAWSTFFSAYSVTLDSLVKDPNQLKKILDLQVIPNVVLTLSSVTDGQQLTTNSGANTLTVNKANGVVKFVSAKNSATAIGAEYYVGNTTTATVIIIDTVLIPAGYGAAALASPSSLIMLVCSIVSVSFLQAFGRSAQ